MRNQWKKFFDCVPEGEPLIEITDQEYITTKRLLKMGMWACRDCGNLMPVEENKCKECGAEKFIVTQGKFDTPTELQEKLYLNKKSQQESGQVIDGWDKSRNEKADRIAAKTNHNRPAILKKVS